MAGFRWPGGGRQDQSGGLGLRAPPRGESAVSAQNPSTLPHLQTWTHGTLSSPTGQVLPWALYMSRPPVTPSHGLIPLDRDGSGDHGISKECHPGTHIQHRCFNPGFEAPGRALGWALGTVRAGSEHSSACCFGPCPATIPAQNKGLGCQAKRSGRDAGVMGPGKASKRKSPGASTCLTVCRGGVWTHCPGSKRGTLFPVTQSCWPQLELHQQGLSWSSALTAPSTSSFLQETEDPWTH